MSASAMSTATRPAPVRCARRPPSDKFVSQEEYFPVFDNNCRDLQLLEASVVNNITEFYTYMKAMRDSLRKLSEMPTQPAASGRPGRGGGRRARCLACGDGQRCLPALPRLRERAQSGQGPDRVPAGPGRALDRHPAHRAKCYAFLRKHFNPGDLRRKRLELRAAGYRQDVRDLYNEVKASAGHSDELWVQARETLPVLIVRYNEALDHDLEAGLSG